jgi:hypothetical protein
MKDGGPAYPTDATDFRAGMTMRQFYKAAALGSIPLRRWGHLGKDEIIAAWVTLAAEVADQMITEDEEHS